MGLRFLLAGAVVLSALLCAPRPRTPSRPASTRRSGTPSRSPRTADRLGADWVRLWASWQGMEPAQGQLSPHLVASLDAEVRALKARGVKVLVVVHRAPAWASGGRGGIAPPSDPAAFGALHGRIARAVPGVDAWELWNEPDSGQFWAGGADPPAYAALLRAAYPAIKAAQPSDVVVTGGDGRQQLRVPGRAVRQRRARRLRRGRRAHRHRVPDRRAGRVLPRPAGARGPLHVLRLPRGAPGHGRPRRRRASRSG